MAAPEDSSSKAALVGKLSSVQRILEQQHAQIQSLLEDTKLAAHGMQITRVLNPPDDTTPGRANGPHPAWLESQPSPEIAPSCVTNWGEPKAALVPVATALPEEMEVYGTSRASVRPHNVHERVRRISKVAGLISKMKARAKQNGQGKEHAAKCMDVVPETRVSEESGLSARSNPPAGGGKAGTFLRKITLVKDKDESVKDKAVFCDREAMKEKIRQNIGKPQYNVTQCYKEAGFAQKVARSAWFENSTLAVIALNALWISFDTDLNDKDVWLEAHPVFAVMNNAFCIYFSAELLIRFVAFKHKRDCLHDAWFCFDGLLVLLMILETWVLAVVVVLASGGQSMSGSETNMDILRLVRLLRLTRMARLARLLKSTPEIMILIKGMAVGFRSVCSTLGLMTVVVYLFAIVFRIMGKDTNLENLGFSSVPQSMLTLFVRGVLDLELYSFTQELVKVQIVYCVLLYGFVLLASITVMNMLVGVLVEVVGVVAMVEKEQIDVSFVRGNLENMMSDIDKDGDGTITKEEFKLLLERPEAVRSLISIDVDAVGLIDFTDYIFSSEQPLTFGQFMEVLLQLRGTNRATVKDMVDLRKMCMQEFVRLQSIIVESAAGVHRLNSS